MKAETNATHYMYVASFFADVEAAITIYEWSSGEGQLRRLGSVSEGTVNPFALAVDPSQRFLLSADSLDGTASPNGGAISVHAIDPETGALSYLGGQPSGGKIPVYVSLSSDGRFAFTANCGVFDGPPECGSIRVYPIGPDGALQPFCAERLHEGSSSAAPRQLAAHPHAVLLDPDDRWLFVPDLGTDTIEIYAFDSNTGALSSKPVASTALAPGSGPRHLRLHPNGRFGYLITEIANTIVALAYDEKTPSLAPFQTVSTLPPNFRGESDCADLLIHPSGRFLYGTNRGHDSIVIFEIDGSSGELTPVGHVSTRGSMPQGLCLDPSGRFLITGNVASDTLAVFSLDPNSGRLTAHGDLVAVPRPSWIAFAS